MRFSSWWVLVAVAVIASSCTTAPTAPPSTVVSAATSTLSEPDASSEAPVVVEVPPGLDVGPIDVRVEDQANVPRADESLPDGAVAAGPVVDVSTDGALTGAVQLVFPVEVADPVDRSLPVGGVSYYDDGTDAWVFVDADWDSERRALVVTTDHLSLWQPWTWDWGQIVGDISAGIGRLVGKRAAPPTCSGTVPEWVRDVVYVDYPTNPILACAESDPADPEIAVVRITNNRPYAMVLTPTTRFAWAQVDLPDSIREVAKAQTIAQTGAPDALLVPALTESAVGIERGRELENRIDAVVSGPSLVVDVALIALDQVGIDDWEVVSLLADCAADGVLTLQGIDVSVDFIGRVFGVVGGCLGNDRFLAEAAAAGVGGAAVQKLTAIGKAYEAYEALQLAADLFVDEMVLYGDDFVTVFARSTPNTPAAEPPTEVEIADLIGCTDQCHVSGTVQLNHPSWGEVTLATYAPAEGSGEVGMVVVDTSRKVVWEWAVEDDWYYTFQPAGLQGPLYPISGSVVSSASDSLGHIFIDYDPGRYNGVIVLKPTVDGFEDFNTLGERDDYAKRFYFAETVDVDGDGQFEIVDYFTDCEPSCAGADITSTIMRWNGDDYVADSGAGAGLTQPFGVATPLAVDGMGGVRVGMTLSEVAEATGQTIDSDFYEYLDVTEGNCYFGWVAGLDGVYFTMNGAGPNSSPLDGTVGAINISDPTFSTDTGVGVGDSETDLLERFGDDLIATPHEYVEDGTYYDLFSAAASPEPLVMHFVVEGGTVVKVSAGYENWATLVEGCL